MKTFLSCILRKHQSKLKIKYVTEDANISYLLQKIFSSTIKSLRSLINLKFCKRGRKRKNTNIPLSEANSTKIQWHKAIKKNPHKFSVRSWQLISFSWKRNPLDWHGPIRVEVSILQTSCITLLILQNQTNTWFYFRIIITNSGSLPSSSARLNFI